MGTKGRICLEPAEPTREAAGNVRMKLGKRVLRGEEDPEQCRGWSLLLLDSPGPPAASLPPSLLVFHPPLPSIPSATFPFPIPGALPPGGACRRGMNEQTGAFTPLSPVNLPQPRESKAGSASTARATGIKPAKNLQSQEFREESECLHVRTGINL